jgi:ferrous iron transport protein B
MRPRVGARRSAAQVHVSAIDNPITVALAGQPNVGKSTVFNMLTGLSQHVGNWPGKTIEQKIGVVDVNGISLQLVDLPGTYSLTANSEEERIARDFILRQRPDAVVVIVNAATLERNLYLIAELLALPAPLVIGLNMTDVAERHGIYIEPHVLAAALGMPVVPLVASKNQGLRELVEAVRCVLDHATACAPECRLCTPTAPARPTLTAEHLAVLTEVHQLIGGKVPEPYPEDWAALKLLEGDVEITRLMRQAAADVWDQIHALLMQHEDAYLDIVGGRYQWIERMMRVAVLQPRAGIVCLTDRVDKIATHPLWGLMLLCGMLGLVFGLTYTVALPIVDWLDKVVVASLAEWVRAALADAPAWLSGLVVDGLIGGAGTVLTFLPILIVFFVVLGVLEDIGYLARAAYVMDRFMHWMGLHGRSFLPLFLGFGCNVPAVMGARIVEEHRARLLTILLTPLVPCAARLAVVAFLAPAFFGGAAALVTWGLVVVNVVILAFTGIAINRLAFKGAHTAFIMEMPLYHMPNARTIGLFVWHNVREFVRKAGTLILLMSTIVWVFSMLPGGDVEQSWLAELGRRLEPVGQLVGLSDWRLIVALLTSFIAKENAIATLGILYGSSTSGVGLSEQVATTLTSAAALAFLVVQMLFIPCLATVAVIKQETASWRWTTYSVGLMLVISLAMGVLVYQVGRWL